MSTTLSPDRTTSTSGGSTATTAPGASAGGTTDAPTTVLSSGGPSRPGRGIASKLLAVVAILALVVPVALAVERFDLVVDGTTTSLTQFSGTVGEVLASQEVMLEEGDQVTPGVDAEVTDGMVIEVERAGQFTVVVDGHEHEVATVADDVAGVVQAAGVDDIRSAEVVPAMGAPAADGDVINITRPVSYFVAVDGTVEFVEMLPASTAEVLASVGVELGDDDIVSRPLDEQVPSGHTVTVMRVEVVEETEETVLEFDTDWVQAEDRYVGDDGEVTAGSDGLRVDTYRVELADGLERSRELVTSDVTEPVDRVVEIGAKPLPPPEPEPEPEPVVAAPAPSSSPSSSSSSSSSSSTPAPAPAPAPEPEPEPEAPTSPSGSVWDRLAECESNGRWDLNVGLYDGGLQFHPQTWNTWKKSSYPEYAWQATKAQQIEAASRLQAAAGWGPWPACSDKLGLR